jgi:hypothetical protein
MKEITLRVPDIMLLAGTRVALGVGVGLLVASRLNERARRGAGWALLAVGALTTVPIVLNARASVAGRLEGESAERGRRIMGLGEGRDAGAVRDQPTAP